MFLFLPCAMPNLLDLTIYHCDLKPFNFTVWEFPIDLSNKACLGWDSRMRELILATVALYPRWLKLISYGIDHISTRALEFYYSSQNSNYKACLVCCRSIIQVFFGAIILKIRFHYFGNKWIKRDLRGIKKGKHGKYENKLIKFLIFAMYFNK